MGTFALSYQIYPSADAPEGSPVIERNADLIGTFRKVGRQNIINLDMDKNSWVENNIPISAYTVKSAS